MFYPGKAVQIIYVKGVDPKNKSIKNLFIIKKKLKN